MDAELLQQIRDKILGVTGVEHGGLTSELYLQEIRDAILSVTGGVFGCLNEAIYLQEIRDAVLGVTAAPGTYGSLASHVYLQQIRDAYLGVTSTPVGSQDDGIYLDEILGAAGPSTPAWLTAGGLSLTDWVVAYDAINAESQADSYINLINPGTNDAGIGVAPTWDAVNGWTFNGTTQYLTTITVLKEYSLVIQYTNYDGVNFIFGAFQASTQASCINVNGGQMQVYWQDSNCLNAGLFTDGVYIVNSRWAGVIYNGALPYRNGVADATPTASGGTDTTIPSFIGCVNYPAGGGAFGFSAIKIQRLGILNRELTQPEITALAAALNA